MNGPYEFATIEAKWQRYWESAATFATANPGEAGFDAARPKFYCLDFFPYPSGAGLHVGHPEGYTATDVLARWRRMRGYHVLHPMGWDAFGLPAEQYAIDTNTHPRETTAKNVANFKRQLKALGFCYDWSRELSTTDPAYYRWTQWIFLRLFDSYYDASSRRARPIAELVKKLESEQLLIDPDGSLVAAPQGGLQQIVGQINAGRYWHEMSPVEQREFLDVQRLAFVAESPVNWCPALGTVLANEEVTNEGRSERGNHPVFRRPLKQWMLRITRYADRLAEDLDGVDWPEPVKLMQRNWIGRSEGARVRFPVSVEVGATAADPPRAAQRDGAFDGPEIEIFTTRPDTLFGATYMVLSPEHPLLDSDDPDCIVPRAWPADVPDSWRGGRSGIDGGRLFDTPRAALHAYQQAAAQRSERDRSADAKVKTGVFTGAFAFNPVFGASDPRARIPIFTADYVLAGYGSGAIMAVPAHDTRDFEFARAFGLPIRDVGYSAAGMAMRYYAEHATAAEAGGDLWRRALADLLGAAAAENAAPDRFGAILHAVRAAEHDDQATPPRLREMNDDVLAALPALANRPRGASRPTWLETLTLLEFDDFSAFREVFAAARFHDHAGAAVEAGGYAANSANDEVSLNGLRTDEAKRAINAYLESADIGRGHVTYKLRDWLFSRQRYWGEPFPVVHLGDGSVHGIADDELPVTLPEMDDFRPRAMPEDSAADPEPPLGRAAAWTRVRVWIDAAGRAHTVAPGSPAEAAARAAGHHIHDARRELNTMPQWAGSCWYYLRFCDPRNDQALIGKEAERYWMVSNRRDGTPHHGGVDLYLGGTEHAVLHLLYARFWHKVLFDLGVVSTPEPFGKLYNQGMIRAFCYRDAREVPHGYDEIDFRDDGAYLKATGEKLAAAVEKMSKTLKNVINPDDVVREVGADSLRLYELFMGPLDQSKPWNPRDVPGVYRFLQRVWRLVVDPDSGTLNRKIVGDSIGVSTRMPHPVSQGMPHPVSGAAESGWVGAAGREDPLERTLHATIARVTDDLDRMAFNTAIAAMMEFVNAATAAEKLHRDQLERFVLLLAPFAPHIAEELWQRLRGTAWTTSLAYESWPTFDPALTRSDTIELAVQVNGKVRGKITLPADADDRAAELAALADAKIVEAIGDKQVRKVIVIRGRVVNVVVG